MPLFCGSVESPQPDVQSISRHRLPPRLAVDEDVCLGEDVLELLHRSEALSLLGLSHLSVLQHVVEHEDEGAWLRPPLRGTRRLVELRLGSFQEVRQRLIVEIARHPYHIDGVVLSLPHKVLHGSFRDATNPRVL